ncbi:MAG: valine--tRNA ligase [Candidatus Omnitrophica bacterium]|nr:valine--tRNA ligase [Candidatus Omnitrophota bacterium]
MELSSRFNFSEVDAKWSQYWVDNNLFHAEVNPDKKPYTVVIPPPNVTGILHMGHALNNTLQDIMIRYKRMRGFEALWMPGTDHAGIATQNVVERQLSKEGKTRHDLSREEFLERLWAWKREYGDTIIHQLKKLGASCDWPRARFTMDEGYSQAVRSVFIRLYKKGLIYQGEYIINWCPRCQTALSDEEAEHRELQGNLYHLRYPFQDDPDQFIVVATTRPETMLGDTAVAVNPKDKRYKKYIGKTLILPFVNREIKVISDEFVDSKFGTGAVKVTPAHDPNDFAMGKRHKLEFVNVMKPDGVLNQHAGQFEGMDRFKAREAIVEELGQLKLIEKIEPHTHAVGHCYRCHTVVEPYLSKQWFVKMEPLAKPAIEAVRKGKIKFYPSRWTKVYLNWMENIRDWCISRQIWWGHRIPVWYCVGDDHCQLACKAPIVSETVPVACPHCGSTNLKQDEDVLDTWFSSWLWPFATFGWPDSGKKDLDYFYPTASLFTAPEIIFFWVARMIMAGKEFMGDIPFSDVYIHGTVRDAKGRKMSKSLGNAIDPLEIIKEYGADALRFSLVINSGQDLFISKEKFEIGRNFANKLWNASRLVLMNIKDPDIDVDLGKLDKKALDLPSRWIIFRFYATAEKVSAANERYQFSQAESLLYEFFRGNFCDWYLELIKDRWPDPAVQKIAFGILRDTLKIMHPFMPFVTEELWEKISKEKGPLCRQSWPVVSRKLIDKNADKEMQTLMALVAAIRNVRSQWNVNPAEQIECRLITVSTKDAVLIEENTAVLKQMARLGNALIEPARIVGPAGSGAKNSDTVKNAVTVLVGNIKCVIPLGGVIDVDKEKKKILGQVQEQEKALDGLAQRLKNKEFLKKAPAEIVAKEKERLTSLNARVTELRLVIASLE